MNNTKNNHYVPRFYLKKFCDTDNKIWKLDKTNNNIYHPDTLNSECNKKNLYTIKNKISETDIDVIIKVFNLDKQPMILKTLNYLVYFLNDEIGNLFNIEYSKDTEIEKQINDLLKSDLNNSSISRTQEILITELFEQKFIPIYEQIITTNNIDFINQNFNEESLTFYTCINITKFVFIYLQRKLEDIVNVEIPNELKSITIKDNIFYNFVLYIFLQEVRTHNVIKQIQDAPVLSKL